MRYLLILLFFCGLATGMHAQETGMVLMEDCLKKAELNYPTIQNLGLIDEYYGLKKKSISKNLLPSVGFNGQATYQSDVTSITMQIPDESLPFEIPPVSSPTIDKDMYKLNLDISHMVYDGGISKRRKSIEDVNKSIEDNDIGIKLFRLKEVVKNLYFYALFYQKANETLGNLRTDLIEQLRFMNAQVENGLALKTNADVLRAEILKIEQEIETVNANISSSLSMLEVFTGESYDDATRFVLPAKTFVDYPFDNKRIEMDMMSNQQKKTELTKKLVDANYYPKFMWFGTLGYGRPGLNMLLNEFKPYYIVGAGVQWKLWDWKKGSKEKEMLGVRSRMIENEKATFNQNLKAGYEELMVEIRKYKQLIQKDEEIIGLRSDIAKTYSSQLEHGVVTSTEYVIEKNKEARARMDLEYHRIGLSKSVVDYIHLMGKM